MELSLGTHRRWYTPTAIINALNALGNQVPINIKIISDPISQEETSYTLKFDEVDGTNCVVLFGMWYDLDTQVFSLSRSDTVTGIKLFTVDELYGAMGLRAPSNINDLILDYKATGKIDALFPEEASSPATFLQYFLSSGENSKPKETPRLFLEKLVKNVAALDTRLRTFISRKKLPINNVVATAPMVEIRENVFSDADLYASSTKIAVSGATNTSRIKAAQAQEIIEAESIRASDGYLDPVVPVLDKIPTFQRITAREKNSVKVSIERNPSVEIDAKTDEAVRGFDNISSLKRFFVEVSKCAKKSMEVK